MGWLKRNIFFAIGGIVALGLLGAAGYYDFEGWQHNQAQFANLNEVYTTLSGLAQQKPSPGNDKVDNIAAAREQDRQLREWMDQTTNYFQPIGPIPKPAGGALTSELFAGALHQTIAQLQREAEAANVALPPQFDFSFTAHMDRLTFAPGSLDPLSVQLGEVKTVSEILFGAGINALDGIQRVPASPDDASGPQTDYLPDQPVTTDLAVLVPYEVTFRGFSAEIARVLEAFAASPHGFIVKSISVQPAGATATSATGMNDIDAGAPPPPVPVPGKGGLQTVLNEQLLSITLKVEVVKLTRRN
jgi:hypothetical protein